MTKLKRFYYSRHDYNTAVEFVDAESEQHAINLIDPKGAGFRIYPNPKGWGVDIVEGDSNE